MPPKMRGESLGEVTPRGSFYSSRLSEHPWILSHSDRGREIPVDVRLVPVRRTMKKRFVVELKREGWAEIQVEAENEKEAEEIAWAKYQESDDEIRCDDWGCNVRDFEENEEEWHEDEESDDEEEEEEELTLEQRVDLALDEALDNLEEIVGYTPEEVAAKRLEVSSLNDMTGTVTREPGCEVTR